MTKNEYLESQRGKTYSQIVAEQPMEDVVGSIRGENLRDVVAILAGGLQYRLDTTPLPVEAEPLRTALQVAFKYLSLPDYAINLAVPANEMLLIQAVAVGLVTEDESDKFFKLATYQRPLYNITHADCAAYFDVELTDVGDWVELIPTTSRLMLSLHQTAPELTAVRIEQRVSHDGVHWTNWDRMTPIIVQDAGIYYHSLPVSNMQRQVRWRGEQYRISGTIESV